MKKEFLPYYISRFILSLIFPILVWHFTWTAAVMTFVLFGLFLLYLHSGWFSVDLSTPLYPLRLDSHGKEVQRKALIVAIIFGVLLYFLAGSFISGRIALSIGIAVYFVTLFTLFIKT